MEEQENEIEKAVIAVGEYRFDDEYAHLQVPLSKWSSMSQAQRKRHLVRIKTLTLQEAKGFGKKVNQLNSTVPTNSHGEAFTICGEHYCVDGCQLSADILHNMFRKAERLVLAPNSICPSPGSATAKLVESKSEQKPYFVTKKANNRYCCDTDCPMWKCAKICSHTIACAYQDKCLRDFLSKITGTPNFYALSKSGTPSSAGKKAHKRKACTKSSAKAISSLQEEIQSCPTNSSFPVTESTEPAIFPTHNSSLLVSNSVSLPSFTSVTSKPTPEASQSISALLAYVPQCSVSVSQGAVHVSQGAQGAVHVSTAVLASPQPSVVPASVVYCTSSPLPSMHTTSASSPQAVAANLVSKLISQLLTCSRVSNPSTATTVDTTGVAHDHNQVAMAPSNTVNITDPHCLFWVMIVFGNISRCQGCTERIMRGPGGKPLPPPGDLVLQHKEHVMFQNPNFQLFCDLRNVYYHARLVCVRSKYSTFNGHQHLRISNDVQQCLTSQHKAYLAEEFSIRLF